MNWLCSTCRLTLIPGGWSATLTLGLLHVCPSSTLNRRETTESNFPHRGLLARNNFRFARDGETIYGNFITAAEARGGQDLTSRLGCKSTAIVLVAG